MRRRLDPPGEDDRAQPAGPAHQLSAEAGLLRSDPFPTPGTLSESFRTFTLHEPELSTALVPYAQIPPSRPFAAPG
jgi:hypothetical protein